MATETRTYETILITKVDLSEEGLNSILDKCKSVIKDEGQGEILMHDNWQKAKISYPINKEPRGQWTYLRFKSLPAGIDEMHRNLKINENVLRNFTVRAAEDGSDYESLRATMPKDLADRERSRDWKDDRPRKGGFKRKFGGPRSGGYNRDSGSSYGGSRSQQSESTPSTTQSAGAASDSPGSSNDAN